jgi:integrase
MTNPSIEYKQRTILTPKEITNMIKKADKIEKPFFSLRVKAIIALAKIFGKRRSEISTLSMTDLEVNNGYLFITFSLRKKHKKGLFQYIKHLEFSVKKGSLTREELDSKTHAQLISEWQAWTKTKDGYRIKEETVTKKASLDSPYCQMIVEYYNYVKKHYPQSKYLFPSGISVFGDSYIVRNDRHLSGRHLLRLIKTLNPQAWLHLFRETKGAEIAREGGRNLNTLYDVRDTLDLENEETAYRYIRRYGVQEVKA